MFICFLFLLGMFSNDDFLDVRPKRNVKMNIFTDARKTRPLWRAAWLLFGNYMLKRCTHLYKASLTFVKKKRKHDEVRRHLGKVRPIESKSRCLLVFTRDSRALFVMRCTLLWRFTVQVQMKFMI